MPHQHLRFSRDFIFGAATSAYQIEGLVGAAGYARGPSIWDTYFARRPHLDNAKIAADHYNRMVEDVALMKELNLQSYRFSVSWPRVLPRGKGEVNVQGLDFYERLVDELLENDITPHLTLYHWDLPQSMEDVGGWCSQDVARYFADYAALVAERLGNRVPFWTTLNEPEVIVAGYTGADLAPGLNDPKLRFRVIHNLMLAHGYGTEALRSVLDDSAGIGIVLNLVPIDPLNEAAVEVARQRWLRDYAVYLEALFNGAYPDVLTEEIARSGVQPLSKEMERISQPIDFLGINWYLRLVVDEHDSIVTLPDVPRTLMGWEIRAEALTRTLTAIWETYKLPPLYIAENGAALKDVVERGEINDQGRIKYLAEHLEAVLAAVEAGVDVRGYFVWSLLDNLEWSLGFSKTFGIVHIDRETLKRTPKQSALWYANLIRDHLTYGA